MIWIKIEAKEFSNTIEDILKRYSLKNYWLEQTNTQIIIFGEIFQNQLKEIEKLPEVIQVTAIKEPIIDWNAQWKDFNQSQNNLTEIDLNLFLKSKSKTSIYLKPGPGFGSDQHDTTFLMLKLMGQYLEDSILDIGCGSGVLSIAAAKWGMKKVYALDIDSKALIHTEENALLNQVNISVLDYKKLNNRNILPKLCLMNMISSEQTEALTFLLPFLKKTTLFITSGILKTEKTNYLSHSFFSQLKLIKSLDRGIWSGFVFQVHE